MNSASARLTIVPQRLPIRRERIVLVLAQKLPGGRLACGNSR